MTKDSKEGIRNGYWGVYLVELLLIDLAARGCIA
jgi:hypothetical protein